MDMLRASNSSKIHDLTNIFKKNLALQLFYLPKYLIADDVCTHFPLFSSAELYYLQTAQCQADGQSLLHLRLVSLVMIQVQVG